MMHLFKPAFLSLSLLSSVCMNTAWADAKGDAEFIANKLNSNEVIAVQLEAIRGILTPTLQVGLEQNGINLSTKSLRIFTDLFVDEFSIVFTDEYRAASAQTYEEELTAEELADLRAFLETKSGAAYASKQASLLANLSKAGEIVGAKAGIEAGVRIQERLNGNENFGFSKSELEALTSVY